jgi:small GTP-binding protein
MTNSSFKGVTIGNASVGKTTLIDRIKKGEFNPKITPSTAATFVASECNFQGTKVKFSIWDTAGQDRFQDLVPLYLRGAQIAILTFSLTNRESFDALNEWQNKLMDVVPDCEFGLVGTKADLTNDREISYQEAEAKSHEIGAAFYIETSALTGQGVLDVFPRFLESPRMVNLMEETDEKKVQQGPVEKTDRGTSWCGC